jgi:SulP family sulfate permease
MYQEITVDCDAKPTSQAQPEKTCYNKLDITGPRPNEEVLPLHVDILRNLRSGITLGLVNLPLSVSLAIAGGGTPEMGALSAAWGGIVGGFASGSHWTLIAPTGGLSGVLGNFTQQYGVGCLPWLCIFSSLITFLVYFLNLHHYLTIVPSCGMTGFKIGLNPSDPALNWTSHPHFHERVAESISKIPDHTKPWNPVFFCLNMLPLLYLVRFAPPKVRQVPWHIILVVAGIIYGHLIDKNGNTMNLLLLKDRFDIKPYLIGTQSDQVFWSVGGSDMATLDWGGIVVASFSVAVIAVLETQFAAKILDAQKNTEFDSKREILGTGLCNLAAGLAGGMPICGAMARMTLNANCGARSRVSIIINGIMVVILMFALFPLFKECPQPVREPKA